MTKVIKPSDFKPNGIKPSDHLSDPCNSIKRFDICPFDQKNSTYSQPPANESILQAGISIPAENGIGIETFGIGIEVFTNTWVRYWYWVNTNNQFWY